MLMSTGTIGQGVVGGQGKRFDESIDNPFNLANQ
jgi:hypothetical protein